MLNEESHGTHSCVLLVGMHRSGTSCLAGSLQQLRGKEFFPPEKSPIFLVGIPAQALDFLRFSAQAAGSPVGRT